ncbi:hypothetical protein JCM19379_25870 [Methyloparacoccus murrellii]
MAANQALIPSASPKAGAMLLGTGLAFASLILVPAFATRLGLGMALTGAVRIALMRASSRVVSGRKNGGETDTGCMSCH